jgi:flagellar protein FliT
MVNTDARNLRHAGWRLTVPQTLIDYYRAIEDSSAKMLDAAKMEDWDQVVRFEGACAVLIEQLRDRAAQEELMPDQRSEKIRIMQRILQNDAQIRYLAEPWLTHCEQNMDGQRQYLH